MKIPTKRPFIPLGGNNVRIHRSTAIEIKEITRAGSRSYTLARLPKRYEYENTKSFGLA